MPHNTRSQYLVQDGLREFDLSVPYLNRNHIKVAVNGLSQAFTWLTDSRIRLNNLPADGSVVRITRETPIDAALVTFHDGSNLTKEELNTAILQLLYREQEQDDFIRGSLEQATIRLGNQLGVVTTPESVADELLLISEFGEDLLDRLRANIAGIDLNAEAIVDQGLQLTQQAFNTTALTGTVATLNGRVDNVVGILDGLADLETGGLATLLQHEADQRIEGDTAIAQTISLIGAVNGTGNAFDLNLTTARVSPTESLGERLTALSAQHGSNLARIIEEETARATADSAIASTIALLGATNGDNSAFILDQNTVLTGPSETLAQKFSQLLSTAGTNAQALVTSEATARTTAINALTNTVTSQGSQIGSNTAAIATESSTRASAIQAEADARSALAVQVAQNGAAIINEATVRANAIAAETTARQSLASVVGSNTAAIQTEATTRANADASFAQTFAILGAANGSNTAFVLDMNKVQVGGGVSMASRLSGIDTAVGNNSAAIANEITARTSADSALSQSLSTVSTTLDGNTAAVTSLTSSVNGVLAKAGVVTDVNGYLTGWLLNNNGSSGSFAVLADNFSIRSTSTGTRTEWIDGIWYVYDPSTGARTLYGKTFGGSDNLVWWTGPASIAAGSESKANAWVYISTVHPRFGGSDVNQGGGSSGGIPPTNTTAGCNIAGSSWQQCKTFTLTGVPISPMVVFNWQLSAMASSGTESAQFRLRESGTGGAVIGTTDYLSFSEFATPAQSIDFYGAGNLNGSVTYVLEGRCAGSVFVSGSGSAEFSAFQNLP